MQTKRIGMVIPTAIELEPLLALLPKVVRQSDHPWEIYKSGSELNIIVSYIGPANAAAAAERLITEFQPDLILHGGSAGAINPELMPGDIVIGKACKIICSPHILQVRKSLLLSAKGVRYVRDGEAVHLEQLEADSELLMTAEDLLQQSMFDSDVWAEGGWPADLPKRAAKVLIGVLGSQDGWTKGKEELAFIRTEFGVDSEDMESAYVAQIAAKHGIPFLAVRAISNNESVQSLAKNEIIPAVKAAAERVARALSAMALRLLP